MAARKKKPARIKVRDKLLLEIPVYEFDNILLGDFVGRLAALDAQHEQLYIAEHRDWDENVDGIEFYTMRDETDEEYDKRVNVAAANAEANKKRIKMQLAVWKDAYPEMF